MFKLVFIRRAAVECRVVLHKRDTLALDGSDLYRELAREIGLDPELLAIQMDSDEVHRLLADDIALARELGVTGTPAMFLDGRPVSELCDTPAFWRNYAKTHARPAGFEIAGVVASENVR